MRHLPEDFWPEELSRAGETATAAQMAAAWRLWEGGDGARLIGFLVGQGAGDDSKLWSCSRLADAMLQRARKAGHISYEKGKWTDAGSEYP